MPKQSTKKHQPDDDAGFWRLPAVLTYVQRSRSAIYRDPTFPKPVKLSPHTSAWVSDEVKAWRADRIAESRRGTR